MKIRMAVEAWADFDIDVDGRVLDEVARFHNGDFEEWAKSNWNDYFDIDDLDIEIDYCRFDKSEAKELLEKVREAIGSSSEDLSRVALERTKLEHSLIPGATPSNIKEINVDIDLLDTCLSWTDLRNPKIELNYIHLKDNIVEATDTRRLIRFNNSKVKNDDICFPTYFVEPLKNGAECFKNENGELFLKYNDKYYRGLEHKQCIGGTPKFPDTDRIAIPDIDKSDIPKMHMSDLKATHVSIDEFQDAIELVFNKDKIYINKMYYDEAIKHNIDYIATYSKNGETLPLFMFNDKVQIVIMPIFPDKNSKIEVIMGEV